MQFLQQTPLCFDICNNTVIADIKILQTYTLTVGATLFNKDIAWGRQKILVVGKWPGSCENFKNDLLCHS